MWGNPTHEQDPLPPQRGLRRIADGIGTAIYDPGPSGWEVKLAGRERRHRQEAVEQAGQQAYPVATLQPVIGHRGAPAAQPGSQRGHAAGQAAHVVGVHDVGVSKLSDETGRDRMGRVAPEMHRGMQHANSQTPLLSILESAPTEADKLAIYLRSECAGQLERVSLPATEQATRTELRGSNMDDSHTQVLKIALITLGDPNTLTGGYLYHRRLAALAPRHSARIEFVSFPPR